MEGLFGVAMLANLDAFQKGEPIPYIWTSGSFGAFVWFGGLGLVLAILIFQETVIIEKLLNLV
ncbi:hypothetical protein SPAR33_1988 [Streptococcus pneumoniae GA13723]|nr:hypothetical protein SPAR33_1988 [Streptococcus pneumoniae GA13723]